MEAGPATRRRGHYDTGAALDAVCCPDRHVARCRRRVTHLVNAKHPLCRVQQEHRKQRASDHW